MSNSIEKYSSFWLTENNILVDKELYKVNTIADGSCFIHSYLYAINHQKYREKNKDEKVDLAKNYRLKIGKKVLEFLSKKNTNVYSSLREFSKFLEGDDSMKWIDKVKNYVESEINSLNVFLGDNFWYIFTNIFPGKHNLIIFRDVDIKSYLCHNKFKNSKDFIIVLNTNDSHYEPIGYYNKKNFITEFERSDVKDIVNYCRHMKDNEEISDNESTNMKVSTNDSIDVESKNNNLDQNNEDTQDEESINKITYENDENSTNDEDDVNDDIIDKDEDEDSDKNDVEFFDDEYETFENIDEDDVELVLYSENKSLIKSDRDDNDILNFTNIQAQNLIKELIGSEAVKNKSMIIAGNYVKLLDDINETNLFEKKNTYERMYSFKNCYPICKVKKIKFEDYISDDEIEEERDEDYIKQRHFYIFDQSNNKYIGFYSFNNLGKYFEEFDIFGMCKIPNRNKNYESSKEYNKPDKYMSYITNQETGTWKFFNDIDFINDSTINRNDEVSDFISVKSSSKAKMDPYFNEHPWPKDFKFLNKENSYEINQETFYPGYFKALKNDNISLSGMLVKNDNNSNEFLTFDYDNYIENINRLKRNENIKVRNLITKEIYENVIFKGDKVKIDGKLYDYMDYLIYFNSDNNYFMYTKDKFFNSNIYFKSSQENFKEMHDHLVPTVKDFLKLYCKVKAFKDLNNELKEFYSTDISKLTYDENNVFLQEYKYLPNTNYYLTDKSQKDKIESIKLKLIDDKYLIDTIKSFKDKSRILSNNGISNSNINNIKSINYDIYNIDLIKKAKKSYEDIDVNVKIEDKEYDTEKIYVDDNNKIYERLGKHFQYSHEMPKTYIYPKNYSIDVKQNILEEEILSKSSMKNENIPISNMKNESYMFDQNLQKQNELIKNRGDQFIHSLFSIINKISNEIKESSDGMQNSELPLSVQTSILNGYILPFFLNEQDKIKSIKKLIKSKKNKDDFETKIEDLINSVSDRSKVKDKNKVMLTFCKKLIQNISKYTEDDEADIIKSDTANIDVNLYNDSFKPIIKERTNLKDMQRKRTPEYDKSKILDEYIYNNKENIYDENIRKFMKENKFTKDENEDEDINDDLEYKKWLANWLTNYSMLKKEVINLLEINNISQHVTFDIVPKLNKLIIRSENESKVYLKNIVHLKRSKISYDEKQKILEMCIYEIILKNKDTIDINEVKSLFKILPIDIEINSINAQYNNFGGKSSYDNAVLRYSNKTTEEELLSKEIVENDKRVNDNQDDNDGNFSLVD